MQRNVGRADAWIRGGLAVLLFGMAAILNHLSLVSLAAALAALILVGTALTRSCPLYRVLGIDSQRDRRTGHA